MTHHHIGDTGTAFRGRIVDQAGNVVDISTATTKELRFVPPATVPAAPAKVVTAVFPTPGSLGYPSGSPGDGTDGYMEFVTTPGHLDGAGTWKWQGFVVVPGLGDRNTDLYSFEVEYNLA